MLDIFRVGFARFPNPHIRTNAFGVRCRDYAQLASKRTFKSKRECHQFESGKNGLSAFMINGGKDVLVIDRFGRAFKPTEWFHSATFSSFGQANCAVSDNRTREYDAADEFVKHRHFVSAWGITPVIKGDTRSYL